MKQPPLFSIETDTEGRERFTPRRFDGRTFDTQMDGKRLSRQLDAARRLMLDGQWRTIGEIAEHVEGSEAGISARLRDLRKLRFGGYTVDRRRRGGGLFEYRITKGQHDG